MVSCISPKFLFGKETLEVWRRMLAAEVKAAFSSSFRLVMLTVWSAIRKCMICFECSVLHSTTNFSVHQLPPPSNYWVRYCSLNAKCHIRFHQFALNWSISVWFSHSDEIMSYIFVSLRIIHHISVQIDYFNEYLTIFYQIKLYIAFKAHRRRSS